MTLLDKCKEELPKEIKKPNRPCINAEMHQFGQCFSCERNEGFNTCLAQIKSESLPKIMEVLKEDIKKIKVKWPQFESDAYDQGCRDTQRRILELLNHKQ